MLGWCFIIIFTLNDFDHASGVRQFVSIAPTLATTHEVGMFILPPPCPPCRLGAQNLDPVAHWQTQHSHSGFGTMKAECSTPADRIASLPRPSVCVASARNTAFPCTET